VLEIIKKSTAPISKSNFVNPSLKT